VTKDEWLKTNGFNTFGVTYLVLGNSYPIKQNLKDEGFKFSPLLRWHGPECKYLLPPTCFYKELKYEEIFLWSDTEQTTFMKEGSRDILENIFNPKEESTSNYVGEIGERFYNLPVVVKNIRGFDSDFGYKYVYTFIDNNGNLFSWCTTVQIAAAAGSSGMLSGTIKNHTEYKDVKTTQLSRCIFTSSDSDFSIGY
jgi:hypothetical protein